MLRSIRSSGWTTTTTAIKLFDFVVAAADRDGNVYVAGRPNGEFWFVRKFTASSNSWATVDVFRANGYGGWPNAVACDPAGRVFVVGTFATSSLGNGFGWAVRRSLDGGASWKTVDTFQLDVTEPTSPEGVATDAKGNVYVVGNGFSSNGHWLVRMSSDGGNTWRTIEDLTVANGGGASSIGVDSTGRLNVLGGFYDTAAVGHLVLRRSSDGGATWVNVDDFVYGVNSTFGASILALPDGSTLAGGRAYISSGYLTWLVRRLPPPPPK